MHASDYTYHVENQSFKGFLAYDKRLTQPRPAVLVAHDWTGRSDFACHKAKLLAEMGYVGFALDMYGEGRLGNTTEEKKALLQPLLDDRHVLANRLQAAYKALIALPQVDAERTAIIGFCFGGLCALDLARHEKRLKAAISFHGGLTKPSDLHSSPIHAKILVLHGYEDPLAPPQQVNEFCEEMTTAKADWQVHLYGHVKHSFTNPQANDEAAGLVYNRLADKRSWQAMTNLLQEVFNV